jgi:hypothetical protein
MVCGMFLAEDAAMTRGRPKAALTTSDDERSQLKGVARSRSLPSALSSTEGTEFWMEARARVELAWTDLQSAA